MFVNQSNYFLLIILMIFARSLCSLESSSSDEDDSIIYRRRRQIDLEKEANGCTDNCITTWYSYAVSQGLYTLKQLHDLCRQNCRKEVENLLTNSKQTTQEQQEEGVDDYYRSLQPVSSSKTDCEIKCLANKENPSSLNLRQKRKLCQQKCANN